MSDHELFKKQLIRHMLKDQLDLLQKDGKGKNNSFAFLENNTLDMLILSWLMKGSPPQQDKLEMEGVGELIEKIESMMEEQKHEFESIITQLKAIQE